MDTPSELIDELGGTSAVAVELNLTPSTVSSWKTAGRIPNWRLPAIRQLAKRKSVALPEWAITGVHPSKASPPFPVEAAA